MAALDYAAAEAVSASWQPGALEMLPVLVCAVAGFAACVCLGGATSEDEASTPEKRRTAARWLAGWSALFVACAAVVPVAYFMRDARLSEACSIFLSGVASGEVREIDSIVQDRVRSGCGEGPLQAAANAADAKVQLH